MELLLFALQEKEVKTKLNVLVSSDFHYDPLYNENGSASSCREAVQGSTPAPVGRIGCDGT